MTQFDAHALDKICRKFNIEPSQATSINTGLVNSTYKITDTNGNKYILQEISPAFKDVARLMNNMDKVTAHIRKQAQLSGKDPNRSTINLLQNNGKSYVSISDDDGLLHHFRMYNYIDNATTYDQADAEKLREAGRGFGEFQRQLSNFPATDLAESIPDFHNTLNRFVNCVNAIDLATKTKSQEFLQEIQPEIEFVLGNALYADIVRSCWSLPVRVVHNDTKLNNVIIDDLTHKAICIIDLDTVMPGTIVSDYGDAIRFCANTGLEDDQNLENIGIDWEKVEAFTDGYMSEVAPCLERSELELLPYGPMLLSYELGMRFFTDYLTGNKYFRCTRPNHNLERTRAQFTLCTKFIQNLDKMQDIIICAYERATDKQS